MNHDCPKKPKRKYTKNKYSEQNAEIKKFRSSKTWQNKRQEIVERDLHLCQVCIRELYDWCVDKYVYEDISVHHIDKISEAWDKRLDNNNLITLCSCCHTEADMGGIPVDILLKIVEEQEAK